MLCYVWFLFVFWAFILLGTRFGTTSLVGLIWRTTSQNLAPLNCLIYWRLLAVGILLWLFSLAHRTGRLARRWTWSGGPATWFLMFTLALFPHHVPLLLFLFRLLALERRRADHGSPTSRWPLYFNLIGFFFPLALLLLFLCSLNNLLLYTRPLSNISIKDCLRVIVVVGIESCKLSNAH